MDAISAWSTLPGDTLLTLRACLEDALRLCVSFVASLPLLPTHIGNTLLAEAADDDTTEYVIVSSEGSVGSDGVGSNASGTGSDGDDADVTLAKQVCTLMPYTVTLSHC